MTLHKLMTKLRRSNQEQYRILGLCVFLSVLLVSSFTLMFFSPSVQELLPPGYFVFFRAKDVDSITAAFKEYTGRTLNKAKKPSVRKKLELAKERVAKHREREKTKHKDRGQEL